jgi:hypothetical protein
MKTIGAFFMAACIGLSGFPPPATAQGLRFVDPPSVRRFPDGALEWSGRVSCAEPALLLGARITFSLDSTLGLSTEGPGSAGVFASMALSPADCEDGLLAVHRGFFPSTPAVLRAELRRTRAGDGSLPDSVADVHSVPTGEAGALLAIRRFCARPKNGEPEWIEIRNVSTVAVSLAQARLEGRALSGSLAAGESVTAHAAADTAELRLWQPGARVLPLSSWPGLRNTGDTLRLSLGVAARAGAAATMVLDSVVYGSAASSREACASVPAEESAAGAHGFGLETPAGRWRRRASPLPVAVAAPAGGIYDVRVYNLDGEELCALARVASGPRVFSLSTASCARLPASATALLLQLQPRRAPSVRQVVWADP